VTAIATLYSGFGGVEEGARQAGLELAWGIELDAQIAEVASANLGHRVHVANILDCDPRDFERVNVLHASPPCTSMSLANANGGETALDIALAHQTAGFVKVLQPSIFTLENVWSYRHSRSWHIIEDALHKAGYWVSVEHCNSADYAVPQTRKRMIVRAVRGGFVPYLPEPVPWNSWYAAVEDLLDTLPESCFADWQLARLPEPLTETLMMQVQGEGGDGVRFADEPMQTVTANHAAGKYRAFLMAGGGNTNLAEAHPGKGCRYADEPSHTIPAISSEGGAMPRAWLVGGQNDTQPRRASAPSFTITATEGQHSSRALLDTGRVVSMTPRALARFQSFPDAYELPDNARLAARGIGNAVPPLLYQRIIEPLVKGIDA
jgi:DNA (cytosine-5)-methyltransferase 1